MQRIHTVLVYKFVTGRGSSLMPELCQSYSDIEVAEEYQAEQTDSEFRETRSALIISNKLV